jgi:hypothetical protein
MPPNIATARKLMYSGDADNLAADKSFGPFPVQGRRLSVYAAWTGTPTGTFALQCTFDGTNWTTVPGAAAEFTANSQAQPAGGASSAVWNWSNVPGNMARIRYTRSSGTGTLTIRASSGG